MVRTVLASMVARRSSLGAGLMATACLAVFLLARTAVACPFCSAVAQTFTEEMATMDAVVVAKLVKLPMAAASEGEVAKAQFEVVEVIKGDGHVAPKAQVETVFFGDGKTGDRFLLMGVDPPQLMWSTPLKLSDRAANYIRTLPKLPPDGKDRLAFFMQYLEDPDDMLTRDAYDEFARAPYDDVKALKGDMNHDQLIQWIQNPDIPASRRRLYFVMLGVCGTEKDFALLEKLIRSDDRKDKAGLDSLIACYLTLKGAEGLPLVEEMFLKNKDADYADTYAAIMAIRFHGTESERIEKQRLLESLHYMLDRPELADLVIPDLARWEDWSQMDRLVELFKKADDKTSWVRVPVVNYLRACPKPEAKQLIAELEEIDPAAVNRAKTFFPFSAGQTPSSPDAGK